MPPNIGERGGNGNPNHTLGVFDSSSFRPILGRFPKCGGVGRAKQATMSRTRDRDFLFCDLCGTMLDLSSLKYTNCPLCRSKKSTKEIAGREIVYRVTAQDIRRTLGISSFAEGKLKLATIERLCDKCGNNEFEYTRKQLRSADEGQTTFLTCTKCKDTVVEN